MESLLEGRTFTLLGSKRPLAACQYTYHPTIRIEHIRPRLPQAPKLTSQENNANLGAKRKKGGKPPKADKRPRKARLKRRPYRWGWGQAP